MKKWISSIIVGVYIGIGATLYTVIENKIVGSFFFCVGIFLVLNFYNMLFTKVVPHYTHKKYKINDMVISFFGNLVGTIICSFLISLTRLNEKIVPRINKIVEVKLNDTYVSIFIMAIFCAILVTYATFGEKIYPDNKILSVISTFLFITAFAICGFDHIVANMFFYSYYAIEHGFSLNLLPSLMTILIGNIIGGLGTGYLEYYRTEKCQTKN